jgi:hypothetical protein
LPGEANPFHIKRFPTEPAQRRRLRADSGHAGVTDRGNPGGEQRPSANPAIGWKKSSYEVIDCGPNHPSRPSKQARHRANVRHPTR